MQSRVYRRHVWVAAAILGALLVGGLADARDLTFEERVQAQRSIEEVYWRHRIWPRENATPKPTLDAVMPESAIRTKVEDYLAKSNALGRWWKHTIEVDQLQAEMDRMAKQTTDGETLRDLFHALGDDPSLIAETLARQTLVDRLIRNWYASDARFHGELKAKVEAAVGACTSVGCMKSMGGDYHEVVWTLGSEKARGQAEVGAAEIGLDPDEWDDHLARLASKLGAPADALPMGRLSAIEDTGDALVVTAVLGQRDRRLVTASVTWPKRTFDAWWEGERGASGTRTTLAYGAFKLPLVPLTACTNNTWRPTLSPMEGRYTHATVWTGSEMIVWGGYNGSNLNTGGRYDPATDTWTPTSTGANVPNGRQYPTAVWSGSEMIVWGGYTGSYLSSGGRYNPVTDSWTATSTGSNVPAGRFGHTAVWTGSQMIVWGGNNNPYLNTGGRYDPATDLWTPTSTGANVPVARHNHTAVWTGTQMIVWGGFNGTFLKTGGRYDAATDSWAPTSTGANVPDGRFSHTAVWTGTEMVVWGGLNSHSLNTGGRYDPATDSWTTTSTGANVPEIRWQHTAIWTGTQMIVWGGYNPSYIKTGGQYDPATDSWTPTSMGANVPSGRSRHSAVWSGTRMIIWGGHSSSSFNTGGQYDPASDSWTPTSTGAVAAPNLRRNHTAVWTGTEMIVWGGYDGTYLNTGGRYDPATDSWTLTSMGASVPGGRYRHTAVWTGTEMIVWGGNNGSNLNTGGRYDPATDSWTATSTDAGAPAARSLHAAVWTGMQMIVWGGTNSSSYLNTGGRYDPATDSWTSTSTGANTPLARCAHSAVWSGREMIVWGGSNIAYLNTGGRYDPTTDSWTPTSMAANTPVARQDHTAVWTGTRMIVWGGYGYSNNAGTVWNTGGQYDADTDSWTPTSTGPNVPAARQYHTAVWSGSEMIVWGGFSNSFPSSDLNSGGRFNPATDSWTATSTGANVPRSREQHTAVWTGTEMVVWGGNGFSTGGRYCARPIVVRQVDGDGYGNASRSEGR